MEANEIEEGEFSHETSSWINVDGHCYICCRIQGHHENVHSTDWEE